MATRKKRKRPVRRGGARDAQRETKAAAIALLDARLGTALAHGAKALKYATRRKNPPLPVRTFTNARGHLVSRRVLALDYFNAGSAQGRPYRHEFDSPVELWALRDGSLLLRGAGGKRLWDDFFVRDGE